MTAILPPDIHLARRGEVTCRNHQRLGYDRLARGVYGKYPSTAGSDEWEARRGAFLAQVAAIVVTYADKGITLYGPTAMQALGVALPTPLEDWGHCHILIPPTVSQSVRRGVVIHRTTREFEPDWYLSLRLSAIALAASGSAPRTDGFPYLHPVEHWLQFYRASIDELVEIGDGLLRRQCGLCTLAEVTAKLADLDGRRGVDKVRQALRWVRPGTDSILETRTRLVIVRAGLPEPVVNHEAWIRGNHYWIDLAYPDERIGVEYDGAVHVKDRTQMEKDINRRRILQDDGWIIITVAAPDLRQPEEIVRSVESALVLRRGRAQRQW
ncbi:MAG: DUF559 domain-containing protein [Propionibacteriaceae bacterium]|jgi:very-short-patch-repair endonuclease|nr:DUF559 domain-containing protein [Propionibacteriaceae bacterium]